MAISVRMVKRLERWKAWLYTPQAQPGLFKTIVWWELRRLPFNLIIGSIGFICGVICLVFISKFARLRPGEDPLEPLVVILIPVLMNAVYTVAEISQVLATVAGLGSTELGPKLLSLVFRAWICLFFMPVVLWIISLLFKVLAYL